jgi:SNF2 family DNA or RNA helicase
MADLLHDMQMGLGKTAQSISTLEFQRQLCDIQGPFLIVAPLTTLGHWQREVETWTSMVSH